MAFCSPTRLICRQYAAELGCTLLNQLLGEEAILCNKTQLRRQHANHALTAFVLSELQAFKLGILVGKRMLVSKTPSIPAALNEMLVESVASKYPIDVDDESPYDITSGEVPTEPQLLKFYYAEAQKILVYYESLENN